MKKAIIGLLGVLVFTGALAATEARAAEPDFTVKGIVKELQDQNRLKHEFALVWITGVLMGEAQANADMWATFTGGKQIPTTCKHVPSGDDAAAYLQLPRIYSSQGGELAMEVLWQYLMRVCFPAKTKP